MGRLLPVISEHKGGEIPLTREQLKQTFTNYDTNKDEKLSWDELKSAFKYLKSRFPSIRTELAFHKCDKDENGYIDYGKEMDSLVAYAEESSTVDASFWRLGIGKLSIGDVQRLEWDQLEAKIRRWIRAAKVCDRVLFVSKKKLCEQIFENLGTDIEDACFVETVKGSAIQLFNLFEAISISRRSPEKLFKILDLHDALMVLML
ncbi:hypothetical protein SO802_004448 [Lithocarpus litseifolius]|uniref:Exocyst subunit Exo70 family protein n=1 Tax=Lithocarpus litseifolius TaxID=425828 RepID=A0AAW2E6Z3_9ROSI